MVYRLPSAKTRDGSRITGSPVAGVMREHKSSIVDVLCKVFLGKIMFVLRYLFSPFGEISKKQFWFTIIPFGALASLMFFVLAVMYTLDDDIYYCEELIGAELRSKALLSMQSHFKIYLIWAFFVFICLCSLAKFRRKLRLNHIPVYILFALLPITVIIMWGSGLYYGYSCGLEGELPEPEAKYYSIFSFTDPARSMLAYLILSFFVSIISSFQKTPENT